MQWQTAQFGYLRNYQNFSCIVNGHQPEAAGWHGLAHALRDQYRSYSGFPSSSMVSVCYPTMVIRNGPIVRINNLEYLPVVSQSGSDEVSKLGQR